MFVICSNAAVSGGVIVVVVIVNVGTDDFNDTVECLIVFGIVEEVGIDGPLEILFVGVEEGIVGGSSGVGGGG